MATVERRYNEQAPDGSWRYVEQMSDGTYTRRTIPTSDYAAANIPGASSTTSTATAGQYGTVPGMEYYNDAANQIKLQAAIAAAQQEYLNKKMQLIDAPVSQAQILQMAMQSATAVANQILQGSMAQAQEVIQRLGGLQSAAMMRAQEVAQRFNALQSAAALRSQEALGALQLAASLRGPRNAFQQQQVMMGLNEAGLTRAVDAIAGRYSVPGLSAPQAAPQAATLQTQADDMALAGGQNPNRLTPSDVAFGAALSMWNAPLYADEYAHAANQLWQSPLYTNQGAQAGQWLQGQYNNIMWPQIGSPGTTGGYQTANGMRTVDQMRQELVQASGGMDHWKNAPDDQVISEYGKVTGSPVTQVQGTAGTPATTGGFRAPTNQVAGGSGDRWGVGVSSATSLAPTGSVRYNTVNGPRTMDQMRQELQVAGYSGPMDDNSIIKIYGATAVSPEATQIAQGLQIHPKIVQGFMNQYGRAPQNIPELEAYMNQVGARDPNTGALTGKLPEITYNITPIQDTATPGGGTGGSGTAPPTFGYQWPPPSSGYQVPNLQQPPYSTSIAEYAKAAPAPNQIVGREFLRMPQSSQQFLLSMYEALGYAPDDVLYQVQQGLPKFQAPQVGTLA